MIEVVFIKKIELDLQIVGTNKTFIHDVVNFLGHSFWILKQISDEFRATKNCLRLKTLKYLDKIP
jgi:hypothetical protein